MIAKVLLLMELELPYVVASNQQLLRVFVELGSDSLAESKGMHT